ncbi:MarR family winged helix-turn-helix transcriptional regulator [Lysinibacillus sp. NPDC095746]|uniref:MarR family winged helix-turn-helix transcriptional regulator n=1 Tax=unclassified Lysinibacillus TaxID=2636778 RepID=UPI00236370E4|nr:MarR family transcriptional regulator [Lysinibacillus sp. CNPSo 3705]MDD1504792.1 MarR family transcriptional regulator [Lysinibacillus sp. CNPSo 3705]
MDKDLVHLVKEINQVEYETNLMLTEEFSSLFDETLTTKQAVFLNLLQTKGPLQTYELAKLMGTSPSAVSQLVNRLEQEDYIKRTMSKKDRREVIIELDERGHLYFQKQEEIELAIIDKYYTKLNKEDLLQLKDILLKLRFIISEEQEKNKRS